MNGSNNKCTAKQRGTKVNLMEALTETETGSSVSVADQPK